MEGHSIPRLELRTVTDTEEFRGLQSQWNSLCERANRKHLFSSFNWWFDAWTAYAQPSGRKLRLVTGWVDGQLVLVWPLMREGRVLRMLTSGTHEYRDVIVDPTPAAAQWVKQAWTYVRKTIDADLYLLQDLLTPGPLAELLRGDSSARRIDEALLRVIRLDRFDSWDAYLASLPKSLLADQRRQWRRLERDLPTVTFRVVETRAEVLQVMEWIGRHKIAWAKARKLNPSWYVTDTIWGNLKGAALRALDQGTLLMTVLGDDERFLSANWGFVCGDEFLFHAFAYDPKFATYSPSRLLLERIVRVCFERGISTFDFMPGDQPYKLAWANDSVGEETYTGALNFRGRCLLALARLQPLAERLKQWLRPTYQLLPRPVRAAIFGALSNLRLVSSALSPRTPGPPDPE